MPQTETELVTKIWQVVGTLAVGGFGGLLVPIIKDWLVVKKLKCEYLDKGYAGKHLLKLRNDNTFRASIYNVSLQFWSDGKLRYEQPWDEFKDSGEKVYYISCANETREASIIRHVFYVEPSCVYPLSVEIDSEKLIGLIFQVVSETGRGYEMRLVFKSNVRNGIFRFKRRREYQISLPTRAKDKEGRK